MGVTVVITTLNEGGTIARLWQGLLGQTRPPDEIILVDGGSTDNTVIVTQTFADRLPLRVLVRPGCNISQGRNIGIAAATHDLIATTDGGCWPAPDWLEQLLAPLLADKQVGLVSGRVIPSAQDHLSACIGQCSLAFQMSIGGETFLPTARTLAFRRSVWAQVGSFLEMMAFGEDAKFVVDAAAIKAMRVANQAIIYWEPRQTYIQVLRQFYQYADGLGRAGLSRQFHLKTALQSGGMVAGLVSGLIGRQRWLGVVGLAIGVWYLWRKAQAGCFAVPGWQTIYRVPLVLFVIHLGTMAGMIHGNWVRVSRSAVQPVSTSAKKLNG